MATEPIVRQTSRINFGIYTADEIRKLSVKRITNPVLLDDTNLPTKGGLYDPALGATSPHEKCVTCSLSYFHCPGHAGHIDLVLPVYNPILFDSLFQVLRAKCFYCDRLKVSRLSVEVFLGKIKLLEYGLLEEAMDLDPTTLFQEEAEEVMQVDGDKDGEKKTGKTKSVAKQLEESHIGMVKEYVKRALRNAQKTGPVTQNDLDQRTTNTNNYHTQLIKEFLALGARNNRCLNCEAPSRSFKKNGVGKIFLMSLPNKQRDKLKGMGIDPEGSDPFDMPEEMVEVDDDGEVSARKGKNKKVDRKKKDGKKGKKAEQETFIDDQAEETEGEEETEDEGENAAEAEEGDEYTKQGERIQARGEAEKKAQVAVAARYLTPQVVREYIRKLFAMDNRSLAMIFGRNKRSENGAIERVASPDMFFLDVLPVPPSRFRPANKVGDMLMESPQNVYLGNVLKQNVLLLDMIQQTNEVADASLNGPRGDKGKKEKGKETAQTDVRKVDMVKVQSAWSQMQTSINGLMDSATLGAAAKRMPAGIKQMLEKKQGLFRMHMMGKRVNYACRSVISPDPYIGTHEMGIPMVFATKLTFPEPVTPYNLHEMREAVANGPSVHPGATLVEHEDGRVTSLAALTVEQRQALASQLLTPPEGGRTRHMLGKKVHRHIRTGDVVLANRQPTLHKPSIMAHKVRVLPGEKTLRMHYANCNTYNADFDGDEMNVHFPQSQQARAEAYNIANTDNQYLVPTSGKPLRGLIQDHVASGSVLTARTTLMDRTRYHQLVFTALPDLPGRVRTLPPCIIKPREMWSGKQVVSTILLNVCMEGRNDNEALHLDSQAKIPSSLWGEKSEEGNVIFRHGELLCGVLDKSQFGATSYGLVHACYELYGPEAAGRLLTALGRVFTAYLQFRGLTCGIDDLLLTPAGDEERRKLLKEAETAGAEQVAAFMGQADMAKDVDFLKDGLRDIYRSDEKMAGLDATMKTRLNQLTSNVINACLPGAAQKPFPENNLSLMIQSGAKGSSVNSSQISCLLGQQELEGRRVPVMVSGRSLPSFLPYDTSARSGGYVRGRFLTGIKPQEYFFHCMAGREGLIDTAVKTARSGYLQRCLIKHLEGLRVHYDMTVRDTDGSCVQFAYGEDGCDVTRTAFLEKFEFLHKNESALQGKLKPQEAVQHMNINKATKLFRKVKKSIAKTPENPLDPVLGSLRPDLYLGATSERFHKNLEKHVESGKMTEDGAKDAFRLLMWLKYRASLAEPGEAVGLLAAQGVGEPSTQMTLNTFHFAGFGAMNVTLGIPRLREILMTASEKIKTPAMTIPLLAEVKDPTPVAEKLRHKFTRLTLSDVVSSVAVREWLEVSKHSYGEKSKKGDKHTPAHGPVRKYHVRIEMDREVVASKDVVLTTTELRRGLENQLLPLLNRAVATHIKGKKANSAASVSSLRKAQQDADAEGGNDDEGVDIDEDEKPKRKSGNSDEPAAEGDDENEEGDDENEDGDATDAKNRGKRKERSTYSESEEEEGEEEDEEEGENGAESGEDGNEEEEDGKEVKRDKKEKKGEKTEKVKEEKKVPIKKEEIVAGLLSKFAPFLVQYDYDEVKSQWAEFTLSISGSARKLLLVSLIENLAEKCVVRSVPGIRRALIADPEPTKPNAPVTIQTEGSNVREVWNHGGVLDVNKIYTNDIVMILKTYGVEAARAAIMREVASVFKVYGIGVDMRHLSLIADYMTFEGGYKPFNRIGIDSNPSPLAKMTFETTMKFMKSAVLNGDFDSLRSPSARIVLGRVVEAGTGCVDMLQPLRATQ